MYPNPYQNNNSGGGYPPPPQQGQGYPPQGGAGYPPPSGYPPQSTYPPQQSSYPPQSTAYPPPQSPPPPGYPPHTSGYPPSTSAYPPSSSAYPPPPPTAYPPPSTAPPSMYAPPPGAPAYPPPHQAHQGHPPHQAHQGHPPYGNPGTPTYGAPPMGIPEPHPTGLPSSIPTPMPSYPPQHQPYSPSSPTMVSPPYPSMSQQFHHPPGGTPAVPTTFLCGPLLRYQNLDLHHRWWIGSVLVVSRPEHYTQPPPVLEWSDGRVPPQYVQAERLDSFQNATFWRFELRIPQEETTKRITYSFNTGPKKHSFFVAGREESFRWMFFSCNGFSSSTDAHAIGGRDPLWNDCMAKHEQNPYHVMIGGGDQLYCDGLLNEVELMEWINMNSTAEKERVECNQRWTLAIDRYYFNRYCSWFSEGTYARAMTSIPSVNMWDDHDTIDGYGSYPDSMQRSPVMMTIGATSRRFYLLFQHHSTVALAPRHGFFSAGSGFNILTSLGPSTSLLVLDARSERTKTVVCSNATYDLAFNKMYQEIPQHTGHLLVLLGVPIAYPRLVFAENLMSGVGSVLGGISGAAKVVNKLNGEPELLDDLNDHWTAKLHKSERNKFLTRLQEFSNARRIRVTFLSGDVHCAGVGRFSAKISPPDNDPQLMYQIISSAIVNEPPPEGVIKLLHFQDKVHVLEGRVKTYEDMYPMFTNDVDEKPLQMDKLLPRRNYSHGSFNAYTGGLDITIFAEKVRGGPEGAPGGDKGTKPYSILVPRLV